MTSRNSFLISMRENMKRRMWYPLLLLLIQIFEYPVAVAMVLSNNRINDMRMASGTVSETRIYTYLNSLLGVSTLPVVLAVIFGVLAALQGFSYLNNRKKVDLYHSVPVSKSRRFWVIVTNSFLMYAVIHLLCVLLALGIAALFHCMSGTFFAWAMLDVAFNLVGFLAGFAVTLVAAMLTGNTVVTLLGTAVLAGYELLMRLLVQEHLSSFFNHYSYLSDNSLSLEKLWTSPIAIWVWFVSKVSWADGRAVLDEGMYKTIAGNASWSALPKTLVLIVIFMAVGYVLYRKRGSEAAGKAMAFSGIKQPLKIIMLVPISLTFGLVFRSLSYSPMAFEIFGLVVGLLLGHCIIEMIYEFDLKAPLRHLPSLGVATLLSAVILMFFALDPLGYDRYVPNPDKVEYAGVYLEQMQHGDFVNLEESPEINFSYTSDMEWVLERMKCTDTGLICQLAEQGMKDRTNSDGSRLTYGTVHYHMKNGKDIYRRIALSLDEDRDLLAAVLQDEGYQASAYQLNTKEFENLVGNMTWSYENASRSYDGTRVDIQEIYDTYRKEFNARSFDTMLKEVPVGRINFQLEIQRSENQTSSFNWYYPVYESFTETIALLEQHGMTVQENIPADQVEEISVYGPTINLDELEEGSPEWNYNREWRDVTYTQTEYTKQILQQVYPAFLADWMVDAAYSVYSADIYYVKDAAQDRTYTSGVFLKGEVPGMVIRDITQAQ